MNPAIPFTTTSWRIVNEINNLRGKDVPKLQYKNYITKLVKLEKEANSGVDEIEYQGEKGAVFTVYRLDKTACMRMANKESPKVIQALLQWWEEEEVTPHTTVPNPSDIILTRASKAMGFNVVKVTDDSTGKVTQHFHKSVVNAVYGTQL